MWRNLAEHIESCALELRRCSFQEPGRHKALKFCSIKFSNNRLKGDRLEEFQVFKLENNNYRELLYSLKCKEWNSRK